jgi:hypothetical protein
VLEDFQVRFWGNPSFRAQYETQEAKGALIAARRRYVIERWGQPVVTELADRLSGVSRSLFLSDPLPFSWHSLARLAEIDEAIAQGPMEGRVETMQEFGSAIARYDLSTVYKVLFRFGSPAFVLRRSNVAYSTFMRPGTTRVDTDTQTSGYVTLVTGTLPRYMCRYGITGWITAALELSGGNDVDVQEIECRHLGAPKCRWRATWQDAP